MINLDNILKKLSGAHDLLSSRINNYHNGGSTLKRLSTDSEFTLGLDNRGEAFGIIMGIGLLIAGIIFVLALNMIKTIPVQTFSNIGLIGIFGTCCLVIIGFWCLKLRLQSI